MNDFYSRLIQTVDYLGFNSMNDFAKNGLGYGSSEKLARLNRGNNKPGYEILYDIANKFVQINMQWLLTGRGSMVIGDVPEKSIDENLKTSEPNTLYVSDKEILSAKNETISTLKKALEETIQDKNVYRNLIESKLFNK